MMTASAFAQDGGGGAGDSGARSLDLAKDPFPGMGAMRPDKGEVIQPSGDIAGVGELNDPGNGGTYPQAGPKAFVPGWTLQESSHY